MGDARLVARVRQPDMPLAEVAYPQILSVHEALVAWIRQQGLSEAGAPREVRAMR